MDVLAGMFGSMRVELAVAAGAGMVFVIALAAAIRGALTRRNAVVMDRLDRGPTGSLLEAADFASVVGAPDNRPSLPAWVRRILRPLALLAKPARKEELRHLRQTLIRAGYRSEHAIETFLGLKLLVTPTLTVGFLLVNSSLARRIEFPLDLGMALVLAAITYFLPNLWLRGKINERQLGIERALPDTLDLLVTCVEAGLGLDAAITRVADEMALVAPILAAELKQTHLEVQAGVPRAEAFRRLADRTGVEDLRALSAMLIQTDMFGTSIAKALRVHSEGMRVRRSQRAEEKAAMVSVKMTIPLVLCILPALVAIVMGPAVARIYRNFSGQ
jgi:tight adherence protein C